MPGIKVNGIEHELNIDGTMPLLWLLRDRLGLKGTRYGCGVGICGSCTVLADGRAMRSCVVSAADMAGREVTTIEGLAARGHPVLTAWLRDRVSQCGYCQAGQIMTAVALLEHNADPTDEDIDSALGDVLCRCGTYQRIRRAVHTAAALPPESVQPVSERPAPDDPGVALDDWIRIAPDGRVTLMVNHAEMGQGVTAAMTALVAEELEVEPDRIYTRFAPAQTRYRNPMFNSQTTGGSTSVRGEWERLSLAGARARERLISAAARRWGVQAEACEAHSGEIIHRLDGRRLKYGEIAAQAAQVRPPKQVALKPPERCRLLGRPLPRADAPDMVAGRIRYGLDLVLPGMRVAAIARCPVIGGRPGSYDASDAQSVPGVEQVVTIESGVAVVAADAWSALRGREGLQVDWDPGANINLSDAEIRDQLARALEQTGEVRQALGDVESTLQQSGQGMEAEYSTAPLAHATLEPVNCTARAAEGECEVWVGTQSPEDARQTAAQVSGLPLERVQIHSLYMGGGFGRRLETDMVAETVELAIKTGGPIQVIWDRTDDLRHDYYRPAYRARLRAALDTEGWPLAWFQRGAGADVAGMAHAELPYAIPHILTEFVEAVSALPVGSWRSVGAGQDAFAVESFIDELAHAAGQDPMEYRFALLAHAPRHRAVLELAARAADWGRPASGRHQGIAVYASFGSYVAEVAEVSVTGPDIRVHRVVCAIDCGRTVNPDLIRAQIEGAVANGVSAALKEAVRVDHGRVMQATFEDYPILRLPEMPQVEVYIVEPEGPPGGVGEPGLPPVAPAIANAVAAATGHRLRELPLRLT